MGQDKKKSDYTTYDLAKKAAKVALEKKANNVLILDLKKLTSITDYFVICSGDIDLHVRAIVDEIEKELSPIVKPWHIEGYSNLSWVLMDYVDFVVHVFTDEKRNYYNLERLWADAIIEVIGDNQE